MSLRFIAECFACNNSIYFKLPASTFFNKDSDYIADFEEKMFTCRRVCKKCKEFFYFDLKKNI